MQDTPSASSLPAVLRSAASGPTPHEPEFLGSWVPGISDDHFETLSTLVGDGGQGPALADMTDPERRSLLLRASDHLSRRI